MNRILGRFRLLVPPSSYLIAYVLVYVGCSALATPLNPAFGPAPQLTYPRRAVLIFGLLGYGLTRAFAFHPFFRNGYRKWLESTPWTWRMPLPVGPVRPVWEDAVIVSAMSAPAWYYGDFDPLATFCMALGAYLFAVSLTFSKTGAWGFHVPTIFLVGLSLRLADRPPSNYTAPILLAWAIASVGIGRSLRAWPWNLPTPEIDPQQLESIVQHNPALQTALGWPFDRLGPRRDSAPTWRNLADAFFACVLAAWWFYAILGLAPMNGRGAMSVMVLMYAILFSLINRMARYLGGYAPPLSLGGRFARLRLIIPSYDQVFVAPIAALFAVSSGPWMLMRVGLEVDASAAISLGTALVALFLGGPDRRRWQLTAKCRVVPAVSGSAKVKGGFIRVG